MLPRLLVICCSCIGHVVVEIPFFASSCQIVLVIIVEDLILVKHSIRQVLGRTLVVVILTPRHRNTATTCVRDDVRMSRSRELFSSPLAVLV
jgi:hypothetical protein